MPQRSVRSVSDKAVASDFAAVVVTRAHEALFETASQHANDGRDAEAVMVSQTCCEMVAARALHALRNHPTHAKAEYADLIAETFPKGQDNTYSLRNNRARAAWRALTADRLDQATFWSAYTTHVTRRNRIAHTGHRPTSAEAKNSIKVARLFIDHITQITTATLGDKW
jgi:hypothetical protein